MYCNRALDDSTMFMDEHSRFFSWKTLPPVDSLQWLIAANTSAVSEAHVDAGGFATWVDILLGEKIWYIAVEKEGRTPPRDGFRIDDFLWIGIHLRKGDRL